MVDIEVEIFDKCAKAVLAKFPDAFTSSVNVSAPASYPAMSMVEADNMTDSSRTDSSGETASIVTYDIRVFSNLRQGARTQAKQIAQEVDEVMTSFNFRRTYRGQGASVNDPSVYQVTCRYMAGVTKDGKLYRR